MNAKDKEELKRLLEKLALNHVVTVNTDIPCADRPCRSCCINGECQEKGWHWSQTNWKSVFREDYPEYFI